MSLVLANEHRCKLDIAKTAIRNATPAPARREAAENQPPAKIPTVDIRANLAPWRTTIPVVSKYLPLAQGSTFPAPAADAVTNPAV